MTPPDGYLEIRIFEVYGGKLISCSDCLPHPGNCQHPTSQGTEIPVEPSEVQNRTEPTIPFRGQEVERKTRPGDLQGPPPLSLPSPAEWTALPAELFSGEYRPLL